MRESQCQVSPGICFSEEGEERKQVEARTNGRQGKVLENSGSVTVMVLSHSYLEARITSKLQSYL